MRQIEHQRGLEPQPCDFAGRRVNPSLRCMVRGLGIEPRSLASKASVLAIRTEPRWSYRSESNARSRHTKAVSCLLDDGSNLPVFEVLRRLPDVTVSATDYTFFDLFFDGLQGSSLHQHFSHSFKLGSPYMIELQHDYVGFLAVDTGVLTKIPCQKLSNPGLVLVVPSGGLVQVHTFVALVVGL